MISWFEIYFTKTKHHLRTVFDERLYINMNMLSHKRHKCSTEKLVKKLRQISKVCQFRKYKLYHGRFPGNLSEIVTLFLKTSLWSHFKGINERYQGNEFNYMQQNWSSVLDENIYTQCPISISIFWKGNESDFHTFLFFLGWPFWFTGSFISQYKRFLAFSSRI